MDDYPTYKFDVKKKKKNESRSLDIFSNDDAPGRVSVSVVYENRIKIM